MRSFDEWNDDLPDDGSQPDLPFNGTAPAASSEESEPVKPALGRGPLEELFDAFARGQESGQGLAARQEEDARQDQEDVPPPQAPSQAIVETEVVSLPVALVLQPRESVALVSIPAPPSVEASAAEASPWSEARPLNLASFDAAIGEAVEPTVILPAAPAITVKATEEVAEPVAPPLLAEIADIEPVVVTPVTPATPAAPITPAALLEPSEPIVVKAAIVEAPVAEAAVFAPPVIAPPVIVPPAPRVAAPVPPPPAPVVTPVMKAPVPLPVPVPPVPPAAIVKPPIAIKIKETPKVEPPPRAPERVAHVPEPIVAAEPAPSRGMGRYLAAAAAIIVIIGAIGIPMGKLWATRQQEVAVVTPQPQPQARVTPAPREKRAEPVSAPTPAPVAAPIAEHAATAAAASNATTVVAAKPKPGTLATPAPPRPIASLPTPAVAPPAIAVLAATAASEPVPVLPAPIVAPPAPEPPAPKPAAAEAAAPIGPFFEMAQVDQAPRVLSRVEPQLSAAAQSKDIALVRVLVSQAGQPVLVRMLRPSKGGLAADDAVIEAVKKWTFRPAAKKGEAVSCWLHVAVPLSGGR